MNFLVKRFVAGDTAAEAIEAAKDLNSEKISVTLDFLGEECKNAEQALASAAEIKSCLELIRRAGADCNVSLKLTQLGLNLSEAAAKDNLLSVLDVAAKSDNFVRIDMEGSACTERTLSLFYRVFETRKNVGVVIQAYLRRSAQDIEALIQAKARVRLCKGAYKEPAAVAFQSKEEVNDSYDRLARRLIEAGNYPAIATHDDARIAAAQAAAKAAGIGKERFEFQMLYGVRPGRWREIVRDGYRLRVYVPYGTHWFPYYFRRIRERKENLVFAVRSVLGV